MDSEYAEADLSRKRKKSKKHKKDKRRRALEHDGESENLPLRTYFKPDPDAVPCVGTAQSSASSLYDPNIKIKPDPDRAGSPVHTFDDTTTPLEEAENHFNPLSSPGAPSVLQNNNESSAASRDRQSSHHVEVDESTETGQVNGHQNYTPTSPGPSSSIRSSTTSVYDKNIRIKPDPDSAGLPVIDFGDSATPLEETVNHFYRPPSPGTLSVLQNNESSIAASREQHSSHDVDMESAEGQQTDGDQNYRPASPGPLLPIRSSTTSTCDPNIRIKPDPDRAGLPVIDFGDSATPLEETVNHVYRPPSPGALSVLQNNNESSIAASREQQSSHDADMESAEVQQTDGDQNYRPASPGPLLPIRGSTTSVCDPNTRIKPDPDIAGRCVSDFGDSATPLKETVNHVYRPPSPGAGAPPHLQNNKENSAAPRNQYSSHDVDIEESGEAKQRGDQNYAPASPGPSSPVRTSTTSDYNPNIRLKLDPVRAGPRVVDCDDSVKPMEKTHSHIYRPPSPGAPSLLQNNNESSAESRNQHSSHDVDMEESAEGNRGNGDKNYTPASPGPSSAIQKNEIPKCEYRSLDPEVTNVFQFASKPLPHVEPIRKNEIDFQQAQKLNFPQVPHYKLHTKEEEMGYVGDGPSQPIVYHDAESDVECEGDDPTIPIFDKKERYFKQRGIALQYDFKYFKYPEMKKLAVYQHKDKILEAIEKNHVVVVEGFTGCGKTTQVPQFILDNCVEKEQACSIIVTQPRRLATTSVSERVCAERGWHMGTIIGYQVGMDRKVGPHTMVKYVTTGVLLQSLISARTLKNYTHIVIDEVHERNLETDFLLLIIKKILMEDKTGQERHVKIILMSATLNTGKFSRYFSIQRSRDAEIEQAPIIIIPQTQAKHSVQETFLENLMDEGGLQELEFSREKATLHSTIYETAVRAILSLDGMDRAAASGHSADPRNRGQSYAHLIPENRGSVLVFLPGLAEIDTMMKRLEAETRKEGNLNHQKWIIIPLHSTIHADDQKKAFSRMEKCFRKIILATNIAESSITVPDIVYVIDFCLTKSLDTDPRTNFSCLRTVWASLSQCIQRKGRTGRVAKGHVFRMVPKTFYNTLDRDTIPDMLRAGLETVIVRVKNLGMGSPKEVLALAIDTPHLSGIERAVVNLKELGGLTLYVTKNNQRTYDTCDGDLTFLGRLMSELPVPHQCVRLIMLGHVFGVMKECIIIAAGLSSKSPFNTPFRKKIDAYTKKVSWSNKSYSDCIAILHLYREWSSKYEGTYARERNWAQMSFANIPALREMKRLVEELEQRLRKVDVMPFPYNFGNALTKDDDTLSKEHLVMIKVSIAGAFYPNYFHRQRPSKGYEREKLKEINGGNLFNTVYFKGFPQGQCPSLYGGIVAEKYAFGAGIPKVAFEGQKVLVAFDETTDKIGPISQSVYLAVKHRQLRNRLEIKFLPKHEEFDYYAKQQRILNDRKARYTPCPPQIGLPPIRVVDFFLIVTHVESPSRFWVVYSAHEQKLNMMSEAINRNLGRRHPLREDQIGPEAFCLAPFADESGQLGDLYYRARIRTVRPGNEEVLVYFVDYGNSQWIKASELCTFNHAHVAANLLKEPCLAVECRLACIKPSVLHGSVWHDDAIRNFQGFVKKENLQYKMEIYCVVKNVIVGTLIGVQKEMVEGKEKTIFLNVNQKLKQDTYAEKVEENADCKMNNDVRDRYNLISRDLEQVEACNQEQIEKIHDITYVVPPKDGRIRVELKGPWSPLELSFQSLCHSSYCKEVSIDDCSVNSVALDHEPAAPTSRLVVASSVSIQDKSGRVVARDTTIMPALPGLMSIMAMTFAPKIELRIDNYNTYYTGVLCGLGTDLNSDAAIYQDHDLEIIFDTEIVDSDIIAINKIRYYMNLILRQDQTVNLMPAHKQVVHEMFELIKKPRKALTDEAWPKDSYSWNKIPPELIVSRSEDSHPAGPLDVFLPHSTIEFQNTRAPEVSYDFAI